MEGPAKLVSTTVIRRFKDGKPLIGAITKEFEFKAEAKGKAIVKITIMDAVAKKGMSKEFTLVIE